MVEVPERAPGQTARVLVVDDDPGVREVTIVALQKHGWQAEGAGDGLEALRCLQHREFDVVLTDLQMPRMDGLALLREVRRMEHLLPVVVQTSLLDKPLETRLRWAGAFQVLIKGGPLRDLVWSVERACLASRHDPARCA
jgi:CheY-like chemotaxis protein